MAGWLDSALNPDEGGSYPPYNIEKHSEETYFIRMALAGFSQDDIKIVSHEGMLSIQGIGSSAPQQGDKVTYLHRGIAARSFKRRFQLADSIKVVNADFEHGVFVHPVKAGNS